MLRRKHTASIRTDLVEDCEMLLDIALNPKYADEGS